MSGSEHNPHLRDRHLVRFLLGVLRGKPEVVGHFLEHCPDFVAAGSLGELAENMNAVTGDEAIDPQVLAPRSAATTRTYRAARASSTTTS